MALIVQLETEFGESLEQFLDNGEILSLVNETRDMSSDCPRLVDYIDPYGNTVFNYLQFDKLREELSELRQAAKTQQALQILILLDTMITNAQSDVHRYIKMYGD